MHSSGLGEQRIIEAKVLISGLGGPCIMKPFTKTEIQWDRPGYVITIGQTHIKGVHAFSMGINSKFFYFFKNT